MKPIVYIQTTEEGIPYSTSGEVAVRGFSYLGYEVRLFKKSELASLEIRLEMVVVGGRGTVHTALEKLGVRPPLHSTTPAVLLPYLGREIWRTTLEELLDTKYFNYRVFVKPYENDKLFDARVVRFPEELKALLKPRPGFPPVAKNTWILAQEVVTFVSEWRVYMVRGLPVGISHYKGDLLRFPISEIIRATIGAYRNAPAGYAADFGVTSTGSTLLVEVNEGYSLGAMGLAADRYAELLRARWEEITDA